MIRIEITEKNKDAAIAIKELKIATYFVLQKYRKNLYFSKKNKKK